MLKKIISGGQTGADTGGLIAGLRAGYLTGGHAPKGYKTENGPAPMLRRIFGLVEHELPQYPPRTKLNVKSADATLRFAVNFDSPGEKCTLKAIEQFDKLYRDVNVNDPCPPDLIAEWIKVNDFEVLNIAGNCESTYTGMQTFVTDYLLTVFSFLPTPDFTFYVVTFDDEDKVEKLVGPFRNGNEILKWKRRYEPYSYQVLVAESPND